MSNSLDLNFTKSESNPHFLIYLNGDRIMLSPILNSDNKYKASHEMSYDSKLIIISNCVMECNIHYILETSLMQQLWKYVCENSILDLIIILKFITPVKSDDANKIVPIHNIHLFKVYCENLIKFRALETVEKNPGPGYNILIKCSGVSAYLTRNDNDTFSLTDKIPVDFVISDKEPANFLGDTRLLNELIFKIQQDDAIKANDIVNIFKPRIESSFVLGKFITKRNAKFFVDADHHVSSRGIHKDIDLKLLYLLYPE